MQVHVVDLDFVQVTENDSVGEGSARVFGVDVDAYRCAAAHYYGGFGDFAETDAQGIDAEVLAVDNELRAVAEFLTLVGVQEFGVDGPRNPPASGQ